METHHGTNARNWQKRTEKPGQTGEVIPLSKSRSIKRIDVAKDGSALVFTLRDKNEMDRVVHALNGLAYSSRLTAIDNPDEHVVSHIDHEAGAVTVTLEGWARHPGWRGGWLRPQGAINRLEWHIPAEEKKGVLSTLETMEKHFLEATKQPDAASR